MSGYGTATKGLCDLGKVTSLDLFPYVYNGRVEQAVPDFDDFICLFHIDPSLNLECIS